jgi:hypothetical protein
VKVLTTAKFLPERKPACVSVQSVGFEKNQKRKHRRKPHFIGICSSRRNFCENARDAKTFSVLGHAAV